VIIFVRHGETELNRDGLLQGRIDAPLTERGLAQAATLADALAGSGAVRIVASPLVRAQQTAQAIADRTTLVVETDAALTEIDYGDWDGQPLARVMADAPDVWRTDANFAPPGGESLAAVAARLEGFLAAHGAEGAPVTIAVSHVTPIKAAVTGALGADPLLTWKMHLDVASITRVGYRNAGHYVASFNETGHLFGWSL
jgi:probable phosphoglycerate mutase